MARNLAMDAKDSGEMVAQIEALGSKLAAARDAINQRFIGQDRVVAQVLATILCGGHGLLVGLPGPGKTMLVQTLGTVLGLDTSRVQFTPDLMPADIIGSEVLETAEGGARAFRFIQGPVFCQLLMADEINRASPRTQSALLQAMQEGEVSIAGQTRPLGRPFHVLATQNPLEQEGTYPLPEAQLDRFLMQIDVAYPTLDEERAILLATTGAEMGQAHAVFTAAELIAAQALIRRMPVGETVLAAILSLVRACRPTEAEGRDLRGTLAWGPGPRVAQALMLAVRARALLQGRLVPDLSDVAELAHPVLVHRMALTYGARAAGESCGGVIARQVARHLSLEAAA